MLADPTNYPVFFHCHHGLNRTSMVQIAYRTKYCGWTLAQAADEIERSVGLVKVNHGPDYRHMVSFYENRVSAPAQRHIGCAPGQQLPTPRLASKKPTPQPKGESRAARLARSRPEQLGGSNRVRTGVEDRSTRNRIRIAPEPGSVLDSRTGPTLQLGIDGDRWPAPSRGLHEFLRRLVLSSDTRASVPALEVPRLTIRPARVGDVPGIYEQILVYAEQKQMIRRSHGRALRIDPRVHRRGRRSITGLSAVSRCTYSGKTSPRSEAWRSPSTLRGWAWAVVWSTRAGSGPRARDQVGLRAHERGGVLSNGAVTIASISPSSPNGSGTNACVVRRFPNCQEIALIRSTEPEPDAPAGAPNLAAADLIGVRATA